MKNDTLFHESNRATYCPESNLLHLYVGRVPRDEYDALKAEGWKSTPKQSEAGQGEFAATWTPAREDTAESYAGIIEDEDASPADRAADRAERFSGYLNSRLAEATGHADQYDSGPSAHGFQSKARAVRSADRHDKHAGRALSAWDKAEYWQGRTAGVIGNALYKSQPGVRMGRIKTLEAELRKAEKERAEWVAHYPKPEADSRGIRHLRLRIAYELQMLDEQGGRAALVEMEVGGWLGGKQIHKVNKSNATGRVVSVALKFRTNGKNRWGNPDPTAPEFRAETVNIERLSVESYRAPTEEDKAGLAATKKAEKAAAPKSTAPPLVNPTLADAERLQALINAQFVARWEREHGCTIAAPRCYTVPELPEVCAIPQAVYSANSSGSYAKAETRHFDAGGTLCRSHYGQQCTANAVCKVRTVGHEPVRVIHITDKPAKPFPAAMWQAPAPVLPEAVTA